MVNPPDPAIAMGVAKVASNEAKLVGPVEVSPVREAHSLSPGPYLLCIRGSIPNAPGTRAYAVFFKNNEYVASRSLVDLDTCETQAFYPLGVGPFPAPAKQPPT